jgi:hypothetical protein
MIVGLLGEKGTGKDTSADYIVQKYNFIRYAFANPIKEACRHMFGFNDEQLYGKLKDVADKHWGITPRQAFQVVGTNFAQFILPEQLPELKQFGRYFWVHRFLQFHSQNPNKDIVISDVRFQHEVNAIKKLDGIIIKIYKKTDSSDTHVSETEVNTIKNFDYIVNNNETINSLHKQLTDKMGKILK